MDEMSKENTSKPLKFSRIHTVLIKIISKLNFKKVEKKGRTKEELHEVIKWLTGYGEKKLKTIIDDKVNFETFFKKCKLNKNAPLIKGVICGYRIEELESPLIRNVRYLDKLVDELAKGRKMEKILRVDE